MSTGGTTAVGPEPTFRVERAVVRYPGAAHAALDDVTLEVPVGSLYAVIGPNGSGKSTLMRLLLGVVRAERGSVTFEGRDLTTWTRRTLARAVGAVAQQESTAFPVTVRDLVAMGRFPHLGPLGSEGPRDREAIRAALERCDVAPLSQRVVTSLSGGELQRVRIARALAQEPRTLALDEPTASLDVGHEMNIALLLRDAADRGTTVVWVTHHIDLAARYADRMALLHGGRVAAEGTPAEVLDATVLSRVYAWPIDVRPDGLTGSPRITALDPGGPDQPRGGGPSRSAR